MTPTDERLYYIHVALKEGDRHRIYGPFSSIMEAHEFAKMFAEEGFDVEARLDKPICDFCSSPDIAWGYAAEDFSLQEEMLGWASRGGWAACEECHGLIEKGDRNALAARSVEQFFFYHREVPDNKTFRRMIHAHVLEVHAGFFKMRKGEAVKGTEPL